MMLTRLFSSGRSAAMALALFVLVTRLPALTYPKAIDDEQVYSVVAIEMLHGGQPYITAIDRKPPLLFALYEGILRLAGEYNWYALHVVAVLWTLATMWLLYLVARRLFDPVTGYWAALLYGLFLAWGDYRNLALNGEMLMNLPVTAAVALVLGPQRSKLRPEMCFAGMLVAIAFLLKQPAGIAALPLGLYVLRKDYRRSRGLDWRHSLLHGLLLTLGFGAIFAVAAIILKGEGILREAFYWTVLSQDITFGPTTSVFRHRGFGNGGWFLLSTLPLMIAVMLSIWEGNATDGIWRGSRAEFAALVMWLSVSVLGTAINGQFLLHYFLQLFPPLALLAAPIFAHIWRGERQYRFRILRPAVLGGWLLLTAAVFLVVDTIGCIQHRPRGASAEYVRLHSVEGDRLFVWGQGDRQTGFYLDARRRPATRYIASFPLTGHIFGVWDPSYDTSDRIAPGAWSNLQQDFAAHPPRYIIDTNGFDQPPTYPISKYPYLRDYLASYYREVARTRDGVVYERGTAGPLVSARTCEPRADCPEPRTLR